MNRSEYATLALSGDLTTSEMDLLIRAGFSLPDLYRSRIPFITESKQKKIISNARKIEKILDITDSFITFLDENYPTDLRNIYSPPPIIFLEGNPQLLGRTSIAIVGSRKADGYGRNLAESFSEDLSEAGLTVVSGLAMGIDSSAHRGSLKGKASTIAVLGTGIDIIYPASNRDLFQKIRSGGCLVSEYLPGTPPLKQNFPRRNRIIVGLTRSILVVQASIRSGSLITARLALENGRDVYAVPGDIFRDNSKGTNWLIQNGAKLIATVNDILDEFPGFSRKNVHVAGTESPILGYFTKGSVTFEELLFLTKMSREELLIELTDLQVAGIIDEEFGTWRRKSLL